MPQNLITLVTRQNQNIQTLLPYRFIITCELDNYNKVIRFENVDN